MYTDFINKPYIMYDMAIPERTKRSLIRYARDHVSTGDFLRAVLSNDLFMAIGRADMENLAHLPVIVAFIYNHMPCECWGSRKHYEDWLKGI